MTVFGADVENFYSAHNYSVYKPIGKVLEVIANLRDGDYIIGNENEIKVGIVRYSSSLRFQENLIEVPVYISPKDFLGKRTALFGMTRTGKSNTVKKIIQATVEISKKNNGKPVGQIIFDVNGEYANANLQDEGTAIFELYKDDVIRYSVLNKKDFNVMKVNFYTDILGGLDLVKSHLSNETVDYVKSVVAIDLSEPKNNSDHSSITRYERKKAAYLCCLYQAGFEPPENFKVKFQGNKELRETIPEIENINSNKGITLEEASNWFTVIWDNYNNKFFLDYMIKKGREWADEDLKALLVFLTRKKTPKGNATYSGFRKLRDIIDLHTDTEGKPFGTEITEEIRKGKIVIIDLSQGDPEIQRLYSERICSSIFFNSMDNFIKNQPNNFIQLYFEEAHNLFPKKDDKDLSQIYNRIAKEGAKLNLGLIYATQEVSSISSNILKNTQNWFIAHLNNEDELRELKKYYDFADFAESLIRFSASSDKGFVRMKTYSNPFVVPVQIDRFIAEKES